MRIQVSCYAGHRGEQEPRQLDFDGRQVVVTDVLDRWLEPTYRYFKVRGEDGATYIVRHDEPTDAWTLTLFDRAGIVR
jgi:hypothetical protein